MVIRAIASMFLFTILSSIHVFHNPEKYRPGHTSSAAITLQAENMDIKAIRSEYQRINASNLKRQHFTYESAGCVEDGKVDYFLENGNIVKITESGAIGDGSWQDEYYYSSGKVIFCFETLVGGPAIGKVTKTEYRVYVKDGKAIRVMENKKVLTSESKSAETMATANKIYKAYATKDFVSALCK